jgi:hypothetical protein
MKQRFAPVSSLAREEAFRLMSGRALGPGNDTISNQVDFG